jgi:hypothetical protein
MQTDYLISVDEFCNNHQIEISFINELQHNGLIEVTIINETGFIYLEQLQQLEKIVHLHYELDINMEGIETITYLLQRISSLQEDNIVLRNKLRLYETES